MSRILKLPTASEIRGVRDLLGKFNGNDAIDDPEDLLNDLPYYLEMILALDHELEDTKERFRKCT